jgi:hypothetical protein
MGKHGLIARLLLGTVFGGMLFVLPPGAFADDDCLVSVHDPAGEPIPKNGAACQTAAGKSCTFALQACVNDDAPACAPAQARKHKIHAKGHCGAIGKLQVTSATGQSCGTAAAIRLHTKRNGTKASQCHISISVKTKDHRSDRDDFDLLCNPPSSPCPTITTTSTSSTTTTTICPPCPGGCAAAQIVTSTGVGRLAVSTLPAFDFPAGVTTIINTGPALGCCRHDAIVPSGGFSVPVFCILGLGYTSQVTPLGCASGGSDGKGSIWDANDPANARPDADVLRTGDTSDGTCDTTVQGGPPPMHCNSSAGGAGNNTNGNIDTARGDGIVDPPGVHTQLDIPVRSLTWSNGRDQSADGCPDKVCTNDRTRPCSANPAALNFGDAGCKVCSNNASQFCYVDGDCTGGTCVAGGTCVDGTFDAGVDTSITDFNFILSPTTATANAQFVDQNGDGCSRAGNGPGETHHCSTHPSTICGAQSDCTPNDPNGSCHRRCSNKLDLSCDSDPTACGEGTCLAAACNNDKTVSCTSDTDCVFGSCVAGAIQGVPATGPCCTVGQTTTVVATGLAFTGGSPLYDLVFSNTSPTTITACNPASEPLGSCTLTSDPCQD